MIIKRVKLYSDKEELNLDTLYDKFKAKDKVNANEKLRKAVIGGSAVGLGIGGGLGIVKKKPVLGAAIGTVGGGVTSGLIQKRRQNKIYNTNKKELENILSGLRTKEEKDKFLNVLKDELENN